MRVPFPLALTCAVLIVAAASARAEWRDPITGASPILPASLEFGESMLTVHAAPRRNDPAQEGGPESGSVPRWSQPLTDRRLDPGQRVAPLDISLVDAVKRVEPIYDTTKLDGSFESEPMRISAGTAEMRDLFGDHWRVASTDANVDADVSFIAGAWTAGTTARPCESYRVRRAHDWREPALSAPTAADCRAIRARQARGFSDTAPLAIAIAPPLVPIFAAPEPGSRMSSEDFWAARRARVASIHGHLHRKWSGPTSLSLRGAAD